MWNVQVTVNGQDIPFQRFGKSLSVNHPPPSHQHYYDFSVLPEGMGPVIDLVDVPTSSPLTLTITFADAKAAGAASSFSSLLNGTYGAVTHAIWAKQNLDLERVTPGSNVVEPADVTDLSSVGQHLEYLAGNDVKGFVSALSGVRGMLTRGINQFQQVKSSRAAYSVAVLNNAML